jgi:hypothetical protein
VWTAYNAAQTGEKDQFQILLRDLGKGIAEPETYSPRSGRPRLPLADTVFAAAFKVYSTVSARRFMSDLREAKERGYLSRVPHYNSIFNYLENPTLTPLLRDLIVRSSLPLRGVDLDLPPTRPASRPTNSTAGSITSTGSSARSTIGSRSTSCAGQDQHRDSHRDSRPQRL